MKITFRKPKRSEYKEFARVENSEARQYRAVFTPKECRMLCVGQATVKGLIKAEKIRKYLVAIVGGKMVGSMRYYLKKNNVLWISMIQVLPKHQNQGIGSAMIREIEKRGKKMKAKAIALEAQKKAKWAIRFYKSNKYKIITAKDLRRKPFKDTLEKPPIKHAYIFGKVL